MARPLRLTLWIVAAALLAATLPSAAQGASCTLSERLDPRLKGTAKKGLVTASTGRRLGRFLCVRRKPARSRFFAPTSFWNTPLATRARLDARSKVWVGELRRQLAGTNPWINTTSYSTPLYTVPRHQPRVKVAVDPRAGSRNAWVSPSLTRQFAAVPIPAGARPAPGSDGHMVIWQPSTDTMWEFWVARRRDDGWHAIWGGQMTDVSRNPGHFTDGFGATATGLPLAGGLITIDELRRGRIDHALALAIPHTQIWHRFAAPAQRSDGDIDSPNAIPEGARLRLDPRLDIDALGLPRTTRVVAKAIQKYGMIVRDKSGAVSLYAEDPARTGRNPYPGIFGMHPDRLFDRFPWHRLQVIKTEMRRP